VSLPSDNPLLDVRDLACPADGSRLSRIHLAVGEGETVALLGPAGSGKSTLLACLSGETAPARGAVWINGRPFHLLSAGQKRAFRQRCLGVVHQHGMMLPELSVLENTALPLRFQGVRRAAAAARARAWLERFEIGDLAARPARDLPTGDLRRAALARAMVGDPRLLLADEPFEGLPDRDVDLLSRVLRSTAVSHGTTILAFTRDPAVAARFERTVRLEAGRCAAGPTPRTALAPTVDHRAGHPADPAAAPAAEQLTPPGSISAPTAAAAAQADAARGKAAARVRGAR
jgi:putative ABC transport system ATP-binding protein